MIDRRTVLKGLVGGAVATAVPSALLAAPAPVAASMPASVVLSQAASIRNSIKVGDLVSIVGPVEEYFICSEIDYAGNGTFTRVPDECQPAAIFADLDDDEIDTPADAAAIEGRIS